MHRFFINNELVLEDGNSERAKVLRLRLGELIVLCKGDGFDYICEVKKISKANIEVELNQTIQNTSEPKTQLNIFQSCPKADKMEYIIQKSVEIGAFCVVPFVSERSIKTSGKLNRWQKIAEAAASQSHRAFIPKVFDIMPFENAIKQAKNPLILHPNASVSLKNAIKNFDDCIDLFVGPEGGFSDAEIAYFEAQNLPIISLGKRILRTETAALVAAAQIFYEREE